MVYFKSISYMISHAFLMIFFYLFVTSRYSGRRTLAICLSSFFTLNLLDCLKLQLFPDSGLCYIIVTLAQIFVTQFTGLFIARKRNSRMLFMGLSASNYVIAGSVTASILYIYTDKAALSLAGSVLVHLVILLILFFRIRNICLRCCEGDTLKSWWELCLIPVCFYCSFSFLAFFPHTLYEYPHNIPGSILFLVTMFVSYVVVLRYVESESRRKEAYWKNVMFESYIKGLETQYRLVEQSEKNLKILRHDMRHYSGMIDALLDQGQYEAVKRIAGHINEVVDENKVVRYCDNLIINTILLEAAEQAHACHIQLRLDVTVPREMPVNAYEFAMVLANLLENAVSCVKNLEASERIVSAKIQCDKKHLLVDMENRYEGEIAFNPVTGLPRSKRGEGHGLGMQSVLAFSDRLGGNIGCYCEGGRFRIVLFVNMQGAERRREARGMREEGAEGRREARGMREKGAEGRREARRAQEEGAARDAGGGR